MKKRQLKSKILSMIVLASMLTAVGCGSNDDDDDNGGNSQNQNEQQREEGPARTGPSVVINNIIDQDVRVINKTIVVERNNIVFKYKLVNADPVVHNHFVYIAPNCQQITQNDANSDGMIDQQELEQQVGSPIAELSQTEGAEGDQEHSLPVNVLPANEQNFVFVVYGAEEGINVPVVCNSFNVQQVQAPEPQPEPQPEPTPEPQPEEPQPEPTPEPEPQPGPEEPTP